MVTIKKVTLGAHHLSPGRAKHTISNGRSERSFPPFTKLAITTYGDGSAGYYLMYFCDNHFGTDTLHDTLEEALDQAEWEFGVRPEEWTDVQEPFGG